ncbi:hypothetical protein SAMN04488078_11361, partial [Antarctobacter heliothermus]
MGSGIVNLKSDDRHDCLTVPIRFVAGDFGGEGISSSATKPIGLFIQSPRVASALAGGDDVVSDMYRISTQPDDPEADIIIQSGLSESHGFVLNPGSSILADIFGAATSRTACSELQAKGALLRKGWLRDSSRESSVVAVLHEQTDPAEL